MHWPIIQVEFVPLIIKDGTNSVQSFQCDCPTSMIERLIIFLLSDHNFWLQRCLVAANILHISEGFSRNDSRPCGTCHMAFFLMPLPRAATSTICSANVLLNNILSRNILHFNHPLVLFSYLCVSTKSIRCNSYLFKTTAFLILGMPHELWHKLIVPGNTLSHE